MTNGSARILVLLLLGLVVGHAAPATAALLGLAELRILSRTESIPFAVATFPGVNPVGTSMGSTSATLAPGTAFAGSQIVGPTTTPPTPVPYDQVRIDLVTNASGTFAGTPLNGTAIFTGVLQLSTPGGWFITEPLRLGGPTGTQIVTGFAATAGIPVPAYAQQGAFRTGIVTVGGTAATPLIGTGFNDLTPSGQGRLVLVSPIRITAPMLFDFQAVAELDLRFVPEPASASLFAWGAACLLVLGRHKQRRRRPEVASPVD